jgi:hypothetical protein
VVADQAPEDGDQVERIPLTCPRNRFGRGLASNVQREAGFGSAPGSNGETLVGNVGEGGVPSALGKPQGVAPGASREIEGPAWSQIGASFDEERIRFDGLRFASKKLCVPAIALVG